MAEYVEKSDIASMLLKNGVKSGIVEKCVLNAPGFDVVRCADCWAYEKYRELARAAYLNPDEYCALHRCEFPADGFCSYGKRREDGT